MGDSVEQAAGDVAKTVVKLAAAVAALAAIFGQPGIAAEVATASGAVEPAVNGVVQAIGAVGVLVMSFAKPLKDLGKLFGFK